MMHHLADEVPMEASTLCLLVIDSSVNVARSLAMRRPMAISVVLGLPTMQEPVASVGGQVCSSLRIAEGVNPISWSGFLENFGNGYLVERSRVPEKADAQHESDEELETVGSVSKDTMAGGHCNFVAPLLSFLLQSGHDFGNGAHHSHKFGTTAGTRAGS